MKQELKTIDRFTGEWGELSNFCPVPIRMDTVEFPSVEHAFQALKSKDPLVWKKMSLIPGSEAGKAKAFGRSLKLRDDWEMVKISIMRKCLMKKFSHEFFRKKLLSTGDAILIEGNYWHDNFWGDCYCQKCKNVEGKNNLGKLLMKVRDRIK